MINAKELRIDNLIMYCQMVEPLHGIWEEVFTLPYMIVDAAERPKMYSPIPLTENWLLKFGFKKHKGSQTTSFKKDFFPYWIHFQDSRFCVVIIMNMTMGLSNMSTNCKIFTSFLLAKN